MSDFWSQRIDACQVAIVAIEEAIDYLTAHPDRSWSLDTGQTRQTVTSQSLPDLNKMLDSQLNRLATLEARVKGGSYQVIPGW